MAEKLTSANIFLTSQNIDKNSTKVKRTVFVGGIHLKSTEYEIEDYLSQFAYVESVMLPRSKKSGQLKGYARVVLGSTDDVERLLAKNNHTMGGLNIGISRWSTTEEYLVKKEDVSSRKVYVKFKARIGVDNILAYFSQFGEVEQFDVKSNPHNGRFRDFGYITYMSADSAQAAISNHIHTVMGEEVRAELCKPNAKINHENRFKPSKELAVSGGKEAAILKEEEDLNILTDNQVEKENELTKARLNILRQRPRDIFLAGKVGEPKPIKTSTESNMFMKKKKVFFELGASHTSSEEEFRGNPPILNKGNPFPRPTEDRQPEKTIFKDPPLDKPCSKKYISRWSHVIKRNHQNQVNLQFKVYLPNSTNNYQRSNQPAGST